MTRPAQGIRRKLALMSVLVLLPVLALLIGLVVFVIHHNATTMVQRKHTEELALAGPALGRFWEMARSDVLFLSRTPPIREIIDHAEPAIAAQPLVAGVAGSARARGRANRAASVRGRGVWQSHVGRRRIGTVGVGWCGVWPRDIR